MPEVQWPSSLQAYVNEDGFNYQFGEDILRSENDLGPAKGRRRSTKATDMFTSSITVDVDQYTTFRDWFDVDINGGATRFEMAHPITRETVLCRFKEDPNVRSIGGGNFQINMSLEILP